MEHIWEKVVLGVSAFIGAVAGLFGGWTPLLTVLLVVMGIDYVTGLLVAKRGLSPKTENGGLSSKAGFDGLLKKGFIVAIVAVAALLDSALNTGSAVLKTAACFYYLANEGISILENASLLNVAVPPAIKNALEVMREKGNGENDAKEE